MTFVNYKDMALAIRGFTREDIDGNYIIIVNSRYSYDQQQKTLQHELRHISRKDFDLSIPAHIIENQAS